MFETIFEHTDKYGYFTKIKHYPGTGNFVIISGSRGQDWRDVPACSLRKADFDRLRAALNELEKG